MTDLACQNNKPLTLENKKGLYTQISVIVSDASTTDGDNCVKHVLARSKTLDSNHAGNFSTSPTKAAYHGGSSEAASTSPAASDKSGQNSCSSSVSSRGSSTDKCVRRTSSREQTTTQSPTYSRFLHLPRQRAYSHDISQPSSSKPTRRASSLDTYSSHSERFRDIKVSKSANSSPQHIKEMKTNKVLRRQKMNVTQTESTLANKGSTIRQHSCPVRPTHTPTRIVKAKSEGSRSPRRFAFMLRRNQPIADEDVPLMLDNEIILHEAARKNSLAQVKQLISQKVDVNSRNNLDRTALHWAAAGGNTKICEMLICAGADIESQDKYGMKAVLWAAWFGHTETVQYLVNSGANTRSTNKQGMHLLHCACQNNHVDVVNFIHESLETYKIDDTEKNGKTSLHLAAENGHVQTVEKLLQMKSDATLKDKIGQTAMHLASTNGHSNVVKRLLQSGMEIDDRDQEGRTCIYLAGENGHAECVSTLLTATADPNAESVKEMTPLQVGAQNGHQEVVRTLLEFGCNVNSQNHQGNTALHLATMGEHAEVSAIIAQHGADLNLQNKRMLTALHVAVENGFVNVVEALLVAGADIKIKDKSGKSPLHMAARGSFVTIVDMLIKAERLESFRTTNVLNGAVHVVSASDSDSNQSLPGLPPEKIQFKKSNNRFYGQMKDILFKLAHQQLKPIEWKQMAKFWLFTDDQVKAIEHQHTGEHSFREHGYRMLMIWMHGFRKEDNPMKHLFEGLTAIGKRALAESIRKKANVLAQGSEAQGSCAIS